MMRGSTKGSRWKLFPQVLLLLMTLLTGSCATQYSDKKDKDLVQCRGHLSDCCLYVRQVTHKDENIPCVPCAEQKKSAQIQEHGAVSWNHVYEPDMGDTPTDFTERDLMVQLRVLTVQLYCIVCIVMLFTYALLQYSPLNSKGRSQSKKYSMEEFDDPYHDSCSKEFHRKKEHFDLVHTTADETDTAKRRSQSKIDVENYIHHDYDDELTPGKGFEDGDHDNYSFGCQCPCIKKSEDHLDQGCSYAEETDKGHTFNIKEDEFEEEKVIQESKGPKQHSHTGGSCCLNVDFRQKSDLIEVDFPDLDSESEDEEETAPKTVYCHSDPREIMQITDLAGDTDAVVKGLPALPLSKVGNTETRYCRKIVNGITVSHSYENATSTSPIQCTEQLEDPCTELCISGKVQPYPNTEDALDGIKSEDPPMPQDKSYGYVSTRDEVCRLEHPESYFNSNEDDLEGAEECPYDQHANTDVCLTTQCSLKGSSNFDKSDSGTEDGNDDEDDDEDYSAICSENHVTRDDGLSRRRDNDTRDCIECHVTADKACKDFSSKSDNDSGVYIESHVISDKPCKDLSSPWNCRDSSFGLSYHLDSIVNYSFVSSNASSMYPCWPGRSRCPCSEDREKESKIYKSPSKPSMYSDSSVHSRSPYSKASPQNPVEIRPDASLNTLEHDDFLRCQDRQFDRHSRPSMEQKLKSETKRMTHRRHRSNIGSFIKKSVRKFFSRCQKKRRLKQVVTWRGSYRRNAPYMSSVQILPSQGSITGGQVSGIDNNDSEISERALSADGSNIRSIPEVDIPHLSSLRSSLDTYFSDVISGAISSSDEEMAYEWRRLQTFKSFPLNCPVRPMHLARDGWFYQNQADAVTCFSCHSTHSNWAPGSSSRSYHLQTCRFLQGTSQNVPIHSVRNNSSEVTRDSPTSFLSRGSGGPRIDATLPSAAQNSNDDRPQIVTSINRESSDSRQTSYRSNNADNARQEMTTNTPQQPTVIAQTSSGSEHLLRELSQLQQTQNSDNRYPQESVSGQQPVPVAVQQNSASGQGQTGVAQAVPRSTNPATMENNNVASNLSGSSDTPPLRAENPNPLGISFERPRYPAYAPLTTRVSTFQNWSTRELSQTPRDMALAGFYYAGYGDYVRCFFCGGGLRNWESGDDPWVEHARWYPKCAFVRQNRGDKFVEIVLKKAREVATRTGQREASPSAAAGGETNRNNEMESAAVLSIKEMGYKEDQIRSALNAMKKRLGAGRHTVTAQEILEMIFELADKKKSEQKEKNSPKQKQTSASGTNTQANKNGKKSSLEKEKNAKEKTATGDKPSQEPKSNKSNVDELRSLKEENTQLKEQMLCKICMDNTVSVALLPCGHLVCCNECAPAMRKCPICRQQVKGVVKTYLS